jgi:hypothetical protein
MVNFGDIRLAASRAHLSVAATATSAVLSAVSALDAARLRDLQDFLEQAHSIDLIQLKLLVSSPTVSPHDIGITTNLPLSLARAAAEAKISDRETHALRQRETTAARGRARGTPWIETGKWLLVAIGGGTLALLGERLL